MPEELPQNPPVPDNVPDKVIPRLIEEEMKTAYVNYAMSVIVGRALPDVRDGLKPVHRRILFAMHEMGVTHNKAFKKCARITGDTLGKFHPHGDMAVYDALVRMAQDFSLRYPLIKGQGNFGSLDGDSAAHMRYCITGDTLVLTNKGLLPIEDISNKEEENINLTILNYHGQKKNAVKFFNSGKHKIVKITTEQGYGLKGSYNHPVLCWGMNEFGHLHPCWKLISEITTDDYVMINRNYSLFNEINPSLNKYYPAFIRKEKSITLPKKMNSSLAFLLGALVAEGSFHQKKILFNNQDSEFYEEVKKSIHLNFPEATLYERSIAGNCMELDLYHQCVVRFLDNLGLKNSKAHEKEIPHIIFKSRKEVIRTFLQALFEGDGSIQFIADQGHGGKSIQLSYDSKSKKLLEQIKILLLNFGIISNDLYLDKRSNCYKLCFFGVSNVSTFRKEIGFFSIRKNKTLSKVEQMNNLRMSKTDFIPYLNEYLRKNYPKEFILKNNFNRYNLLEKNYASLIKIITPSDKKIIDWLRDRNFFFNKIKHIERLPEETVYSLKVDSPCHSFVANGFINHNTEAKLNKLAEELLKDLDKETVDFRDNFDGSLKEPVVLPSKFPNLLINGSTGIAVGMATSIPPHNVTEVCKAIIATINNPDISVEELMHIIPGPDFPTGAEVICGPSLHYAYAKGKGKVTIKSVATIEDDQIIITEIPYMLNKAEMIEQIAELVKDKRIVGIRNINDESDREGIRVVIDLKKDVDPNFTLNQLYEYSNLRVSFSIALLALVNNEPKVMGLKEIIQHHLAHRHEVITRRTQYDLNEAEKKVHILNGLLIALARLDEVIPGIRNSRTVEDAQNFLMNTLSLTEIQAKAILELRLQKLASLEQEKIKEEHSSLLGKITYYQSILASTQKVLELIKEELKEIITNYGDARRSKIVHGNDDEYIDWETLIEEERVIVTMTNSGYVKRLPLDTYRTQKRGGKGMKATEMKDEDFVEKVYVASTHDYLLIFTDKGQLYWLKVYNIPEGSRQAKGKHIANVLEMEQGEKITAIVPVRSFTEGYLFMATKQGTVKKTELKEFSNPRKGGIRAINLDETDTLVGVKYTTGNNEIILATKYGQANRFNEEDVRNMGRTACGVRGIRLRKGDEVIGMLAADEGKEILTLTEKGYGKRTPVSEYRLCNRGGKGVTNIKITGKNGAVKVVMLVDGSEDLMVMSKNGIAIRMKCTDISVVGRATQGVRVIKLSESDQLVAAAQMIREENGSGTENIIENSNESGNGDLPEETNPEPELSEAEPVQDAAPTEPASEPNSEPPAE